jgi:hypothetical protein
MEYNDTIFFVKKFSTCSKTLCSFGCVKCEVGVFRYKKFDRLGDIFLALGIVGVKLATWNGPKCLSPTLVILRELSLNLVWMKSDGPCRSAPDIGV